MDDQLVEFSSILRRNGVRVSLSEELDAVSALDLLGIEEPSTFRNALRSTLIKQSRDIATFEELFDLFFYGPAASLKEMDQWTMAQMALDSRLFQEIVERVRDLLKRWDRELSPLTLALLSGDLGGVERRLRQASLGGGLREIQSDSEIGAYSNSIASQLQLARTREEIERFKEVLTQSGEDIETAAKISHYADLRLKALNRLIRNLVRRQLNQNDMALSDRGGLEYLLQKGFAYYTEEDIRRMREVVTELARRFKNVLSVRRKRTPSGRFDVKGTLRRNLQYGGVPFQVQLDRKRREKPQMVVLCDISDSVLNASRFMLQFVYAIQELYSKVRSFVFVSDIAEVTELFEGNDLLRAVDSALQGDIVNVFAHSNFGHAFEVFYEEHRSAITRRTTVLIIGDGRNNYHHPKEWVLREIQHRAKRLIWLNPESRLTWGFGDSEMPRYSPYCHVVEECRSIRQLYKVIDRIMV